MSDTEFLLQEQTPASPAVGTSLTVTLGDNRQLVLQCFFPLDEPEEIGNKLIDKLLRHADRAKARYDLEALVEQFNTVGLQTQGLIDGLPLAEQKFRDARDGIDKEIVNLGIEKGGVAEKAYEAWGAAKKRGEFKLQGASANAVQRINEKIAVLEAKQANNLADRAGYRQELLKSIKHYQEFLARRREKINRLCIFAYGEGADCFVEFMAEEKFEAPKE